MSNGILDRLPRFDTDHSALGTDDGPEILEPITLSGLENDSVETEFENQTDSLEEVSDACTEAMPVLDQKQLEAITESLGKALNALRADAQSKLQMQLHEIAYHVFPVLAHRHYFEEVLNQISRIGSRLPSNVVMQVSEYLADQLVGRIETVAAPASLITLQVSPSLDFGEVKLSWDNGGAQHDIAEALDHALEKYSPFTVMEED